MHLLASVINIFILAAAAFAVAKLWFRGSLFASGRERAKIWAEANSTPVRLLGELLSCPLCLSTQAAVFLSTFLLLPQLFLPGVVSNLCQWSLVTLAAIAFIPTDSIKLEQHDETTRKAGP